MKWLLHCIPSDPIADLSDNDGSTVAKRPVGSTSTVGKRGEKGTCQTSHKQGISLTDYTRYTQYCICEGDCRKRGLRRFAAAAVSIFISLLRERAFVPRRPKCLKTFSTNRYAI